MATLFSNSISEARYFTNKAIKIFNGSIPFKIPVWSMLIIIAWFEAPEIDKIVLK